MTAKGWKRGRPSVWYGGTSRRGTITAHQFASLRWSAGLTREAAAEILGVGLRTIGAWETGQASPSYAAFKLLRVYAQGEFIDPAWSGYRLVRGVLVTPEGRELRPQDMAWMSLLIARARLAGHIAKERDRLRHDLATLRASGDTWAASTRPFWGGSEPPRYDQGEGGGGLQAAPVAMLTWTTVGSATSSLPGPSGQQRGSDDRQQAGTAGQATDASIGLTGSATDCLSTSNAKGERGSHSLTPQNRPQTAALTIDPPEIGGAA